MGFKERYLEEYDEMLGELFNKITNTGDSPTTIDAKEAFNTLHSSAPTESQSKNLLNFVTSNKIPGSQINNTLANMAAGVGKNMDDSEALDIYNKSEQGQNSIPQSHALQNFFERRNTSDNTQLDNLMRGIGKNPNPIEQQQHFMKLLKSGDIPPEEEGFVRRKLSSGFDNIKTLEDLKGTDGESYLYPSLGYGPGIPDQLKDIASNLRAERFGEDDPHKIIEAIARENGDLKYDSAEDYLNQNEALFTQIDQLRQEYRNNGDQSIPFNTWMKQNYPDIQNQFEEGMKEAAKIGEYDHAAKVISKKLAELNKTQ